MRRSSGSLGPELFSQLLQARPWPSSFLASNLCAGGIQFVFSRRLSTWPNLTRVLLGAVGQAAEPLGCNARAPIPEK